MEKQKYTSYKKIDEDLKILKLEKTISYQKMMRTVESTKKSLELKNMLGAAPKAALSFLGGISSPIKSIIFSFILKKIFKL